MRFGDYGDYLKRRWDELGGEAATEKVRQRTGAHREADMPWGRNDEQAQDWANQFKAAQCSIFVQIAGELHHTLGHRDVGLGSKPGGNNFPTANGPIATDIIVLKDLDGGPEVQLVDCFSSMGGPETKPGWAEIEPNSDRTWLQPPAPTGPTPIPIPVPPPTPPTPTIPPELLQRVAELETKGAELARRIDDVARSLAELAAKPTLDKTAVRALVDELLANLVVKGSTNRVVGHAHELELPVVRR